MSIQAQIERLTGAKEDLKTAIKQKGVTVPESTPLEQYASLVEKIAGEGSDYSVQTLVEDTISEEVAEYTKSFSGEQIAELNRARYFCLLMEFPQDFQVNGTLQFGIYRPSWYSYVYAAQNGNVSGAKIVVVYTLDHMDMPVADRVAGYVQLGVANKTVASINVFNGNHWFDSADYIRAQYKNIPVGTKVTMKIVMGGGV